MQDFTIILEIERIPRRSKIEFEMIKLNMLYFLNILGKIQFILMYNYILAMIQNFMGPG